MREKVMKQLNFLFIFEVVLNVIVFALLLFDFIYGPRWSDRVHDMVHIGTIGTGVLAIIVLVFLGRRIYKGLQSIIQTLEEEGAQMDTVTREVMGNITHDLKTPLASIKGYSQGILDGVANTPERLNNYITTIRNKAEDMSGLVDELSFFSQIYQKDIQYKWQDVNAKDYFSSCISNLSLDLEIKKISLIYKFDANPFTELCVDAERLKRVINNIVGNAAKYIQKDLGIVYVHIRETKEDMIVQISDNGAGIAEEELPRIFERFYRTDSSRNSKTGGSGLGLAIAKKIMEDHKGKIWADSEVGKGTKISFSIPKIIDKKEKIS